VARPDSLGKPLDPFSGTGRACRALLQEALPPLRAALKKIHDVWIFEDYYVVQLDPIGQPDGTVLSAEDLIRQNAGEIAARSLEAKKRPFRPVSARSTGSEHVILSSRLTGDRLGRPRSCMTHRLAAAPTMDLLEYANTQLLEFRITMSALRKCLPTL